MGKDFFAVKQKEYYDFEKEVKLHINKQLFEKKLITDEMFIKAKEVIIAS